MYEEATLARDVAVIQIPSGVPMTLKAGRPVTITQALGGAYTVLTEDGYMVRVNGPDADAIGKPKTEAPAVVGGDIKAAVWEQLKTVYDPEIPVNIVDLGLVYECDVNAGKVSVKMSMTAPGCGMGDVLKADAEQKLRSVPGVTETAVEIVWEPPWDQSRMSEAAKLQLGML
jgi:probable FeS assembly SUF system protein SufT